VLVLHKEIIESLCNLSCEVIYVNDGSTDNTYKELIKAVEFSKPPFVVKVLDVHDNYGQSLALKTGLIYASYDVVIFMDGDLQNNPQDIPTLLEKFLEGYDLVQGVRVHRKDPFLTKKMPSKLANVLLSLVCRSQFHDLGCSLKIFYKRNIDNFMFYRGFHRMLPIYYHLKGLKVAEVHVSHRKRIYGATKYGFLRTFDILFEVIKINFFENKSNSFVYLGCAIGAMLFFVSLILLFFRHALNIVLIISMLALIQGFYIVVLSTFLYIGRSFYLYQKQMDFLKEIVHVKVFE